MSNLEDLALRLASTQSEPAKWVQDVIAKRIKRITAKMPPHKRKRGESIRELFVYRVDKTRWLPEQGCRVYITRTID